jgi:uroporphyrinogen-III synthase
MSLEGKTVLITRPHEQATELAAELVKRGATAVVIPMMDIREPESWTACDDALHAIASYDAVMFTSGNAVRKFYERSRIVGVDLASFNKVKLYAVGEKTAAELKRNMLAVEAVPDSFSAASLAALFGRDDVSGMKILFPKGNLAKEDLETKMRELGADVHAVVVYVNAPPPASALEELRQRTLRDEFDVVTFASPSAATNFARAVSPVLLLRGKAKVAVIGPTTRAAVRRLGFPVDIEARTSTSEGLVQAIDEYFSHSG